MLCNNLDKTKFMIISKDQSLKKAKINVEDKTISNDEKIKILGTIFNAKAEWDDNALGKGLILQLKQIYHAVKYLLKSVNTEFARSIANALIISKLNYHIEVWGKSSKLIINIINNILISISRNIFSN